MRLHQAGDDQVGAGADQRAQTTHDGGVAQRDEQLGHRHVRAAAPVLHRCGKHRHHRGVVDEGAQHRRHADQPRLRHEQTPRAPQHPRRHPADRSRRAQRRHHDEQRRDREHGGVGETGQRLQRGQHAAQHQHQHRAHQHEMRGETLPHQQAQRDQHHRNGQPGVESQCRKSHRVQTVSPSSNLELPPNGREQKLPSSALRAPSPARGRREGCRAGACCIAGIHAALDPGATRVICCMGCLREYAEEQELPSSALRAPSPARGRREGCRARPCCIAGIHAAPDSSATKVIRCKGCLRERVEEQELPSSALRAPSPARGRREGCRAGACCIAGIHAAPDSVATRVVRCMACLRECA